MNKRNKSFDEFLAERGYMRGYRHDYQVSFDYGYEAGQQSKQKEIDELNLTIKRLIASEEDIARSCKHWRDSHRELDERITKALTILEDEVIEVDYDEYRFVGNFVDADKVKEILR